MKKLLFIFIIINCINIYSQNSDLYFQSGNNNYIKKHYNEAIINYCKAIELKPNFAKAYYYRGISYSCLQKYEDAISDFNKAIEFIVDDPIIYYSRAIAFFNLKKYDSTINDLDTAIELWPISIDFYLLRGNAYFEIKKYEEAKKDYSYSLNIILIYFLERGDYYSKLIKYDELDKDNKEHLETACYNYGVACYLTEENENAIKSYKIALKINPIKIEALNNLGWAYLHFRNYTESLKYFEKALNIDSLEKGVLLGYALALYLSEKKYESDINLKKLIKLQPEFKNGMSGLEAMKEENYVFTNDDETNIKKMLDYFGYKEYR